MESKKSKVEGGTPLSKLLCPSVDGVVCDLYPVVQEWLKDGGLKLPRDWPVLRFFVCQWKEWLWDDYAALTCSEQLAVQIRIERLLAGEKKERRRVRFLRVWGFLRIWLGALAVLGAVAAWFNGWAWVWWALTGVRLG